MEKTIKKPRGKQGKKTEEKSNIPAENLEIKNTKEIKEPKEEKMYVIPLGGLDEIGKNMSLVQYRDEIIIIDCGVVREGLLGVRFVNPRF